MQKFDLILSNATIMTPSGAQRLDIGILNEKIAALQPSLAGEPRIDCKGLHILPGVIDTQVHFREPGLEHKEDLETGSLAAVMGGVTSVFEMPNTNPLTTSLESLADKVNRATNRMYCDFAFFFGATKENIDLLPIAEKQKGCAGIKIFMGSSTGDLLVQKDEDVLRVLQNGRRRVSVHSEDEARLNERKILQVIGDPSSHPIWRDAKAAYDCTERLIRLAEIANRPVHVLHLSTLDEIPLVAKHKDLISVEVTPHHLTLDGDEAYARLGSFVQMNPPVRSKAHRDALFQAVREGVIDILGSDHAPHLKEEKAKPYPQSPSGMTGVQTLVPIMLDHVNAGRLTLERFVDLTSHGPARLFSIAGKGRIAVGYDADFTLVDMKKQTTITDEWIASRCGWTPYHGVSVTGWPIGTMIRGHMMMWQGKIEQVAKGQAVKFIG